MDVMHGNCKDETLAMFSTVFEPKVAVGSCLSQLRAIMAGESKNDKQVDASSREVIESIVKFFEQAGNSSNAIVLLVTSRPR